MGQAKQRGTFEERKTEAVERDQKRRMAMAEIERRRPSPKHVALMGMIAAMMQGHNVEFRPLDAASSRPVAPGTDG